MGDGPANEISPPTLRFAKNGAPAEDAAHVPYLRAAHEAGVGIAVVHGIEHIVTTP